MNDDGVKYAIVKFLGYNNEESVWLDDIKPSGGVDKRKAQIKAAQAEEAPKDEPKTEAVPASKDAVV